MIENEKQYKLLTDTIEFLKLLFSNFYTLQDEEYSIALPDSDMVKIKENIEKLTRETTQWELKREPLPPPRLINVDLRLAQQYYHTSIKVNTQYLAMIDGDYHAGKFTRYLDNALLFIANGGKIVFLAPGFNGSKWQALWEIESND